MNKKDFAITKQVYLDSAATTLKPTLLGKIMLEFYTKEYANVHRGLYKQAASATKRYEETRQLVSDLLHASNYDIIFTKGTTHSINIFARMIEEYLISKKSPLQAKTILLTAFEHHANYIVWTQLAKRQQMHVDIAPLNGFDLDYTAFKTLANKDVNIIATTHVSNVTGTVIDVKEIARIAKEKNAFSIIDGAQAVSQLPVNVNAINCDAYVFSAHKLYGPTGLGVLCIKKELAKQLSPVEFGGHAIESVSKDSVVFLDSPAKFEPGTPAIAEVIAFGEAIKKYSNKLITNTKPLRNYLLKSLQKIEGIKSIADAKGVGIVSIAIMHAHPHDIASLLADKDICVRAGHHCAMPLHATLGYNSTLRISLGAYNTKKDIDVFVKEFKKALEVFR